MLLYTIFVFLFPYVTTPNHDISYLLYFTTYINILYDFVSCPNKPDEERYRPVEISYAQAAFHVV